MKQKPKFCHLNIYVILIFLLVSNFITIFYIILSKLPSIQRSSDSIEDNPIIINRDSINNINIQNNNENVVNKQNSQISNQQEIKISNNQPRNEYFNIISQISPVQPSQTRPTEKELISGEYWYLPPEDDPIMSKDLWNKRAEEVKESARHIWKSYEEKAFGADELKPISGQKVNRWGNVAMTLMDNLDTLYIMGFKEEFERAKNFLQTFSYKDKVSSVSVFEITIRELGGLLSVYYLSKEEIFLKKAIELGDCLLPVFNSKSGLPYPFISLQSGATSGGWLGSKSGLAEMGTLQLEFRELSRVTGNPKYADCAMKVYKILREINPPNGLYTAFYNTESGKAIGKDYTFGGMGDSFYEYLLKVWLQGNKKEDYLREMYDKAIDGMSNELLQKSSIKGLLYIANIKNGKIEHKMDHLVCFVAGLLALGAYSKSESENAKRDFKNSKSLMYSCFSMYNSTLSGLSPEYSIFQNGKEDISIGKIKYYYLRPEMIESLYILHELTGDVEYREWGYLIYKRIEKKCRVKYGYGVYKDVSKENSELMDKMESFTLSETLKYLYLLFVDKKHVNLTREVLSTEAHILPMFI